MLATIENKVTINSKVFELNRTSEKIFNSPLITKIESDTLLEFIMQFITKLYNDCGQKVNSEDLIIQTNELYNTLKQNYSWLTLNEIPKIFSLGRKKTFGDWFGLNLNTYELWIDGYYSNRRSKEIKKKRKDFKNDYTVKPTKEQNEKAFKNLLTELILEYQSTNKISNIYLYNPLFIRGELPKHTKEFISNTKKRAVKKLYKKKGSKVDTILSNKRIALLKIAHRNGLNEKEANELLKKYKVKDFPKEAYGINKELKQIQTGKKGINYYCKEIILIDYINYKLKT